MLVHRRVTPSITPVPNYTPGWREAFSKETINYEKSLLQTLRDGMPQMGFEPTTPIFDSVDRNSPKKTDNK